MNNLISVIVPVYNVEKYLKKCLDTIINQTYKNIEIFLVDDGSTDKSSEICNEYAKIDERIKVIHKENGGLSDARNVGIGNSNGSYICFIDSDDYLELNMIENLYNSIISNNADISCCGKILEYEKNSIYVNNCTDFCVNNEEALGKMLLKNEIDNSACDKLFKKDLFEGIKFPVGRYFEDIATVYKLFLKSNKVVHIKDLGYHYVLRKNSITTGLFSNKQFDSLYFSKQMIENILKIYPNLEEEANSFLFLEQMTILRKLKRSENAKEFKTEYKKIKKQFNNNLNLLLTNNYIPMYKKIMAILIFFNLYSLVEVLYRIITNKK